MTSLNHYQEVLWPAATLHEVSLLPLPSLCTPTDGYNLFSEGASPAMPWVVTVTVTALWWSLVPFEWSPCNKYDSSITPYTPLLRRNNSVFAFVGVYHTVSYPCITYCHIRSKCTVLLAQWYYFVSRRPLTMSHPPYAFLRTVRMLYRLKGTVPLRDASSHSSR